MRPANQPKGQHMASVHLATGHGVEVGAIFCWSWGYDQTNVDFYEVVGVTAKSVRVREIASEPVPGTDRGGMSCSVRPIPGRFTSEKIETKQVKRTDDDRAYLSKPYGWCEQTTPGEHHHCSWYA
jgi:hypothetical protein